MPWTTMPWTTMPWMHQGTSVLVGLVDRLTDDQLHMPSALPSWSRAHVVGHLARDAEALRRLATSARTREETPMYESAAQRDADIDAAAHQAARILRTELITTAGALTEALFDLDDFAWVTTVRNSAGRPTRATELPWLRAREVWLHAVDLGAGVAMADLPPDLVELMIDDVTVTFAARPDCPAVLLAPTDSERRWRIAPETTEPVILHATCADLAGWLTGRSSGAEIEATLNDHETTPPAAPSWL